MNRACMGALVRYCGHKGVFVADIRVVAGAVVIQANGPITPGNLNRDPGDYQFATHHVSDFPEAGAWLPRIGILVVPDKQVTDLRKRPTRRAG